MTFLLCLLVGLFQVPSTPSTGSQAGTAAADARRHVEAAAAALGGEAALRALGGIRYDAVAHTFLASIATWPEGPSPINYQRTHRFMDLRTRGLRQTVVNQFSFRAPPFTSTLIASDGVAASVAAGTMRAGGPASLYQARDVFLTNPLLAVLDALDAADLHEDAATQLDGAPAYAVAFTRQGVPTRLFIDPSTHLPLALEVTCAYPLDIFNAMWGDVTTRVAFGGWSLEQGGVRFPRIWTTTQNGRRVGQSALIALDLHASLAPDSLAIPDSIRAAFLENMQATPRSFARSNVSDTLVDLAPGLAQVPGIERNYNALVVRQDDGLVVVEAPFSSENSALVMEAAQRRFPGLAVKAVVTTSQMWMHVGGIREYVARGIPVYVLDANEALVEQLVAAPHTMAPDAMQQHPRAPVLRPVSKAVTLGTGDNRMVLYPLRGDGSARMMAAYLPGKKTLYASDMYLPHAYAADHWPEYLAELQALVEREGLDVETVVGLHEPPAPWADVVAQLDAVRR